MVYISSWQDYQEAAEALYTKSPNDVRLTIIGTRPCVGADDNIDFFVESDQTRYCVKWKSSEGKLVLKITDNTTVSIYLRSIWI